MKAYPAAVLFAGMQVSRRGFNDYLRGGTDGDDPLSDRGLKTRMRSIFKLSRGSYGSRRMVRRLGAEGYRIGRHKVRRMMRQLGLKAKMRRRFKVKTENRHSFPVAANILDRRFDAAEPNSRWAADISYVWTLEGWLYLAVVMDLILSADRCGPSTSESKSSCP